MSTEPHRPGKSAALLATARIANVPSVASNVWLGLMLGWLYWSATWKSFWLVWPSDIRSQTAPALLCLGCISIYLGGNFLNDWADRNWDAERRPERPLPSGIFQPGTYLALAIGLTLVGIAAGFSANFAAGIVCLLIASLVSLYTWLHKRHATASLLVAACRGLLVVAGFVLVESIRAQIWTPNPDPNIIDLSYDCHPHRICAALLAPHVFGVFAWTAGLSLLARHESTDRPPAALRAVSRILLFLAFPAMSFWWFFRSPAIATLALLPLGAWLALSLTVWKSPPKRQIGALLAGLPLVDFIAVLPLAIALAPPNASIPGHPFLAIAGLAPVAAFLLGLLLQRIAPAT
jgi:4-hydroxybenzoate polyprenyltransferase